MRTTVALISILFVLGCSAKQPKSGWEYRPPHGAYLPWLFYKFGDGEGTVFIGSCDPEPGFMLTGGAWDGPQFKLTVDGRSWILPTSQGEHGHYLTVDKFTDSDAPMRAVSNAKHSIAFQVGEWRREIRPAAALTRFVQDCG